MNIDKLIVNCVVDSHMVETPLPFSGHENDVNCVVDIFWTNEKIFWSIPETISYGIYWNSSFLLILGWETYNRDVGKKHLKNKKQGRTADDLSCTKLSRLR